MRNRYLLWGIFFFIFLGTGACQPYVNIYLKKLCFPPILLSFVLSSVYFAMAFSRVLVPAILRKINLKKAIIVGSFSYCIFSLFLFLFKNIGLNILGGILWGIGASILWTSTLTMILKISGKERYGVENGYLRFFLHIGLVSGFLILGNIAQIYSLRILFLYAFLFSLAGFFFSLFIKEIKTSFSQVSFFTCFSKPLITFILALFLGSFGYGLILNQINIFISEKFGIDFLSRAIVFFYFSAGFLSFVGGNIIDKIGEKMPLITVFSLSGVFLFLFAFFQSKFFAISVITLLGALFQIVPVATTVRIGKIIPEEKRAGTVASTFFWRDIGIGASILFLGLLRSKFTYQYSFAIIGTMFFLMSILFIAIEDEEKTHKILAG